MARQRTLSKLQKQRYLAILEAAKNLLIEHGFDGVSMRKLAEMADVSAATIYNVFGSKNAVLSAAVEYFNLSFISGRFATISETGFSGLLESNRYVAEIANSNPRFARSVTPMLMQDSSLFGMRQIYAQFHQKFIQQMADSGDLDANADVLSLTYLLMLQNIAALSFWAVDEIAYDALATVFDLNSCNILSTVSKGATKKTIMECHAERSAQLASINLTPFFCKKPELVGGLTIQDILHA